MAVDYAAQQLMETSSRSLGRIWSQQLQLASLGFNMWGAPGASLSRIFEASAGYLDHMTQDFGKPAFNLPTTTIGTKVVPVREEVVLTKPFGDLLHFARDTKRNDPKLLIFAPMSGHYATLLRETVKGMLPHHDVYITDWKNARDVPLSEGSFSLDDYSQYAEDFINHVGPNTHVLAVCQPTVPVFAAVAQMAERREQNQPLSLTLMGGPLDTRHAQGDVNVMPRQKGIEWFKNNMIGQVPQQFDGRGRKVYPGFVQLASFMGMNLENHIESHLNMYLDMIRQNIESAEKRKGFYNEYKAVADLDEAFYIQTVYDIFIRDLLPKGELVLRNQLVVPSFIKTPIFTVEGSRDDIAPPGQTIAAHFMASSLDSSQRRNYLKLGAGHYGIFSGKGFEEDIRHQIASFARETAVDKGLKYSPIPSNTRLMPPNFLRDSDLINQPVLAA